MAKFTKLSIGPSVEVKPLSVSENGTFTAPDGQAYSPVDVAVAPTVEPITITENGVYPVPKGGSLDYGKTVTFKEYISLEDFQAFLQSLGLSKPTDLYAAIAADADAGRAQLLGMTTSSYALRLHYQLLQPKEDGMGSTIIEHLVYGVYLDGSGTHGWGNELTGEMLNEPPTITILSAPPPEPQYEISQFEPLFDIETKSLDGWGDITVNVAGKPIGSPILDLVEVEGEGGGGSKTMLSVTDTNDEGIVASYEIYADDALVDTVPKAETIDIAALGIASGAVITVKAVAISEASNSVEYTTS